MSVGSANGIVGSAAGSPLAQTKGADQERAAQDVAAHQGNVHGQLKAESAAGVGEPDMEDHQTDERDADGRLPWRFPDAKKDREDSSAAPPPGPKDPAGQSGNLLDLSG